MNNTTEKLISELDLYFHACSFEQKKSPDLTTIINSIRNSLTNSFNSPIYGVNLNGQIPPSDDEKIILEIISHCDNSTQDELMDSFGEDSIVAKLIRKKRIEKYNNLRKTYYPYEDLTENLRKEIKAMRTNGNPFYHGVCEYMERLGFKKDSDFYNSIGMPRQQFARLRDAENTLSKKTVLWIIVGLKLNYHEAADLIMKAGYSFRKGDMRDVIITYILRNADYDLTTINDVLDHFGLDPFC